jgi:hypothetical protein
METQLVSIILGFYFTGLLQYIRFFANEVPKKKSKKEPGPFSGTFIKKIFFFKLQNFHEKNVHSY